MAPCSRILAAKSGRRASCQVLALGALLLIAQTAENPGACFLSAGPMESLPPRAGSGGSWRWLGSRRAR